MAAQAFRPVKERKLQKNERRCALCGAVLRPRKTVHEGGPDCLALQTAARMAARGWARTYGLVSAFQRVGVPVEFAPVISGGTEVRDAPWAPEWAVKRVHLVFSVVEGRQGGKRDWLLRRMFADEVFARAVMAIEGLTHGAAKHAAVGQMFDACYSERRGQHVGG